jgi:nucleotide-binding universal stress UspA family protein
MKPYRQILFASNLSPDMMQVFEHAATLAATCNAGIVILHVMEDYARAEDQIRRWLGEGRRQEIRSKVEQSARKTLIGKDLEGHRIQRAIHSLFSGQDQDGEAGKRGSLITNIVVREGSAIADEIVATAVDEGCDLIVLGCGHGRGLTGGVDDDVIRKVLKKSFLPVLTVPFSR